MTVTCETSLRMAAPRWSGHSAPAQNSRDHRASRFRGKHRSALPLHRGAAVDGQWRNAPVHRHRVLAHARRSAVRGDANRARLRFLRRARRFTARRTSSAATSAALNGRDRSSLHSSAIASRSSTSARAIVMRSSAQLEPPSASTPFFTCAPHWPSVQRLRKTGPRIRQRVPLSAGEVRPLRARPSRRLALFGALHCPV